VRANLRTEEIANEQLANPAVQNPFVSAEKPGLRENIYNFLYCGPIKTW
jgi:hypothetical protein